MKIAFLGDSITRGIPKVSYFEFIKEELHNHQLFNYGKGGDTVTSLLRRVKSIKTLDQFDIFVLFIGVNDVYGKINLSHKILKRIRRQVYTDNLETFRLEYQSLIAFLETFNTDIILVPPLIMGEQLDNIWNEELGEFVKIIKDIIKNYNNIHYLPLRDMFLSYLNEVEVSNYLPFSIYETGMDAIQLKTNELVDQKSLERGLHLTLDGVHLNSKGAKMVSKEICQKIKELETNR